MIESSGWPLRLVDLPVPGRLVARSRVVLLSLAVALSLLCGAGALLPHADAAATRLSSVYAYGGAVAAVAALCLVRAASSRRERGAWTLLGLAVVAWGAASLAGRGGAHASFPAPGDAGYLAFYALVGAAIVLRSRSRLERFPAPLFLDGILVALTVTSLITAVGRSGLMHGGGSTLTVAGGFTFPALDSLILTMAAMIVVLHGFRPALDCALVTAGLAVFALSDAISYSRGGLGLHTTGRPLVLAWLLFAVLIGVASCLPPPEASLDDAPEGWVAVIAPTALVFAALVLLACAHLYSFGNVSMTLARASIGFAFLRLFVSFAANQRLLARSRIDAVSDDLTGLGNRRALIADSIALSLGAAAERHVLAIYDLDGFKYYNDTFGHPAGDALLARLAARLENAMAGRAKVYRLGGDEFCLLGAIGEEDAGTLVTEAAGGLVEEGARFAIRPSYGAAIIPTEAADLTDALRLADRRMYAQKATRSSTHPVARDGRSGPL